MRSKKGVALTINFIVLIIVAVVALALGIKVSTNIFSQGQQVANALTPSMEAQLDNLLEKERIAAYPASREIRRGKEATFAIGIVNTEEESQFLVNASIQKGYDEKDKPINYDYSQFEFVYISEYIIAKGNTKKLLLLVKAPDDVPKGTHIINIYACNGEDFPTSCTASNAYDTVEKVYVVVK